jgi:arylsulfatase A-like enzyme
VALVVGLLDAGRVLFELRSLPARAHTAETPLKLATWLPCAAAAVALYSVYLAPVGLLFGVLGGRRGGFLGTWAAAAGCAAGLGFWWTREQLFPGLPISDPRRLGLLAGLVAAAALATWPLARAIAMPGRARWLALPALLVALAGAFQAYGEGRRVAARGVLNPRNRDLPNVLFVVVDALRADRLGCYGNGLGASPVLDDLAQGGVLFEDARVQAPYTWTSFGSWFTGKYPRRHGLLKMAPGVALEPSFTLPQLFKAATRSAGTPLESQDSVAGAFMTGALSHGSGFSQGFDSYVELMMGHPRVDLDSAWSILRARLTLPSVLFKLDAKRDPDALVHRASAFLRENRERRFFAFVHLYSTHTPYDPPEPFRSRFVDPAYDGPIRRFDADIRRVIERGEFTPSPEDVRQIEDLYMGGVAQADHQIGLLLGELEALGLRDQTLVVITSDHGEDLGESGRYEHNHMYRSNLHVPLLLSWPEGQQRLGIAAGRRVAEMVQSVDLLPTLAELAGLSPPAARGPREEIDGRGLVALMQGQGGAPHRYAFAEDSTHVAIDDDRFMLVLDRYAVRPDGWQIALEEQLGTVRLHDLQSDPLQRRDLFELAYRGERPDLELRRAIAGELERLRAALLAWDAGMPIGVEEVVQSDRDLESEDNRRALGGDAETQRQALERLGYLGEQDRGSYSGELRQRVLEKRAGAAPAR